MSCLTSEQNVLLLHDGELADIRAVLEDVGTSWWEALQHATPSSWDLGFATPRHLNRLASVPGWKAHGRRVAVAERDSRTLRVLVHRCSVDGVVRRPVHPTALRLLVKHAVYRKRVGGRPRVAVGAPVNIRVGLRRTGAILADLSLDGCRLLTERSVSRGQRLMIAAPGLEDRRPWFLYGQVVREIQEPDHDGPSVGVRFQYLLPECRKRLEEICEFYRRSPATLTAPCRSIGANASDRANLEEEILLTEVIEDGDATLRFR